MLEKFFSAVQYTDYVLERSERGSIRLYHRGYEYQSHLANRLKPYRYWRCMNYQASTNACKCRAILLTLKGPLRINGYHNHEPYTSFSTNMK